MQPCAGGGKGPCGCGAVWVSLQVSVLLGAGVSAGGRCWGMGEGWRASAPCVPWDMPRVFPHLCPITLARVTRGPMCRSVIFALVATNNR